MSELIQFLKEVHMRSPALQSDFARENAFFIAEAASRGLISSVIENTACNYWTVTEKGLSLMSYGGGGGSLRLQ